MSPQSPQLYTVESRPVDRRLRSPLLVGLSLFLLLAILTACGPASSQAGSEGIAAQTRQIALDYRNSGDLEVARDGLSSLNVANTNQWLVLVTEETIASDRGSETANALVALTLDLGLTSTLISRYAVENDIRRSDVVVQQQPAAQMEPSPTSEVAVVEPEPPVDSEPTAPPAAEPADAPAEPTIVEAEIVEAESPTPEIPVETPTVDTTAQVQAVSPMNVRAGPGTDHPIIAALQTGSSARITAKDSSGEWWQIALDTGSTGWIYAPLVETVGNVSEVAIAQAIPTVPLATPTPVPQPTATPAPVVEQPPAEEPPAEEPVPEQPVEEPTAQPPAAPPAGDGPDFRLVEQRLWDVEENGGFLAGESVNCGEKQVLQVIVEDANGSRLDGVTIQGVYRNELRVTGEKGPGIAELDMNTNGDDIVVLRDVDGREVSSDRAAGNTARTWDIPYAQLIQGRFCKDDASCSKFVDTTGCFGHFSWTVRFQRSY